MSPSLNNKHYRLVKLDKKLVGNRHRENKEKSVNHLVGFLPRLDHGPRTCGEDATVFEPVASTGKPNRLITRTNLLATSTEERNCPVENGGTSV